MDQNEEWETAEEIEALERERDEARARIEAALAVVRDLRDGRVQLRTGSLFDELERALTGRE